MSDEHALFSASAASRWMACPGALALERGRPNTESEAASEGTAAHTLAAWCLESDVSSDAEAFLGRRIDVGHRTFEVDKDMAGHVNTYVNHVLSIAEGHELMVEQRVDYSRYLFGKNTLDVAYRFMNREGVMETRQVSVKDLAFGTSDAVILRDDGELVIIDLKYGANPRNRVDAEDNPQLMLYALGAYDQYSMLGDFDRVRMIIVQPRLDHVSEWVQTVEQLEAFAKKAELAQIHGLNLLSRDPAAIKPLDLNPGEKQCHWCRAKATCPALKDLVGVSVPAVADDFEDLTSGAEALVDEGVTEVVWQAPKAETLELIEQWIKAQRAEIERRLFLGEALADWKVVAGKKGNRAWTNAEEAEAALKGFRLKVEEMYSMTVISPTTAEKLAKAGTIGPRQWAKAQELITQAEGKPSVAPASDKRPGISVTATADDFDVVTDDGADLV